MAVLSLILDSRKLSKIEFPMTSGTSILNFDVLKQVTHEMDSDITNSAIEDGSNIADHVTLKNKRASFEIIISDTPLNTIKNSVIGLATSAIADKIKKSGLLALGTAKIAGLILDKTFTRAQTAFTLLEELRDKRTLINAILGFKKYENSIITNFKITQDQLNTGSMHASLTIEEIKIVKSQATRIPKEQVDKSVESTATSEIDSGKQKANAVSDKTSQGSSVLFSMFQMFK